MSIKLWIAATMKNSTKSSTKKPKGRKPVKEQKKVVKLTVSSKKTTKKPVKKDLPKETDTITPLPAEETKPKIKKQKRASKGSQKQKDALIALEAYFKDISKHSLIDKQREVDLALRAQAGDIEARDALVHANLRLVVSIAKRYSRFANMELTDLISEGNIGLLKAIQKYQPLKYDIRFSTYATWWIRQAIQRSMESKGFMVKLPAGMNRLVRKTFQDPNVAEDQSKTVRENLYQAQQARKMLHSLHYIGGGETDIMGEETDLSEGVVRKEELEILQESIQEMDFRLKEIVVRRFLKNETLSDVGVVLGITRERVRQLQVKAMQVLERIVKRKSGG